MSARQQLSRAAEFALLFLIAPIALWWVGWAGGEVPVVPILVLLGTGVGAYLVWSAPAELRASLSAPWSRRELLRIGLQLCVGAALLLGYVLWASPERLFDLPRERPATWMSLLALYPLASVLPQEVLFRAFFFQRYGPLWSGVVPRILVSGLIFGLAHLLYGSWLTVGLSVVGGTLFSWTFVRTGSLLLVILEHSAYGALLFTIGLGRLFYVGPWP